MNKVNSLTSLRFIAAFMVIGYHFFSFAPPFNFFTHLFSRGYLGVDFFFILSGFVIGIRYQDEIQAGLFQRSKFLYNRMIRIAPAYYLSFILSLPLFIRAVSRTEFLQESFNQILLILLNLTFLQAIFPAVNLWEHWNHPAWSLSVEFIFYLSVPLLSVPLLKTTRPLKWLILVFTLLILSYFLSRLLPTQITFLNYETKIIWLNSPLFRLFQFFIGNLLAILYLQKKYFLSKNYLYLSALFAIGLMTFPSIPKNYLSYFYPISTIIFSMLILTTAIQDKNIQWLNTKWMVYLGEASYSLYIFQAPLKVFFQQIYSKVLFFGESQGFTYCLYLTVCLVGSSVILYQFYEIPMSRFLKKKKLI